MIPALLSPRRVAVVAAAVLGITAWTAPPAQARIWFGFGIPLVGPPPFYYPPPVYYPPPPVYYPPPPPVVYTPPPPPYGATPYSSAPAGFTPSRQTCYAGAYTCPMEHPVPSGAACYCSGNSGQRVSGHAN